MREILSFMNEGYYTSSAYIIFNIAALGVSLLKGKGDLFRYFPVYFLASLAQTIIFYSCYLSNPFDNCKANEIAIFIFTILEGTLFIRFIYISIKSELAKRLITVMYISFILWCLLVAIFRNISNPVLTIQFLFESSILLIPSIFYFVELFKQPYHIVINKEPSFWVISGILFFSTGTLPFVLLQDYIMDRFNELFQKLQSVNYIFYSLLFAMIIKAHTCIPKKL